MIRSAPQTSHVSVWPPRAAVRQAAMARRARCCPRVRRWVARYAVPWVRTKSARSLRRAGRAATTGYAGDDGAGGACSSHSSGEAVAKTVRRARWK